MFGFGQNLVLRLIVPFISCVTLGELFNLPKPQLFSSLKWASGVYLNGAQLTLNYLFCIRIFHARHCAKPQDE